MYKELFKNNKKNNKVIKQDTPKKTEILLPE
jgi:hypothetical protein